MDKNVHVDTKTNLFHPLPLAYPLSLGSVTPFSHDVWRQNLKTLWYEHPQVIEFCQEGKTRRKNIWILN